MNRRLLLSIGSVIGISGTAVGGIFLDKHIKRNNFLSKSEAGASRFESGQNDVKALRNDHSETVWRLSWIMEILSYISNNSQTITQFTKEEMNSRESEFWNFLLKDKTKINIETTEKQRIGNEYSNYWEKYKESCLFMYVYDNISNLENNSLNSNICVVHEARTNEDKYKDVWYWYEEYKKMKDKINIDEFYWTKVKKFQSTDQYNSNSSQEKNNKNKFSEWIAKNK